MKDIVAKGAEKVYVRGSLNVGSKICRDVRRFGLQIVLRKKREKSVDAHPEETCDEERVKTGWSCCGMSRQRL